MISRVWLRNRRPGDRGSISGRGKRRDVVSGQRHAPAALYPGGKDPGTIVQENGWAQELV
jgi:hypothetical protein